MHPVANMKISRQAVANMRTGNSRPREQVDAILGKLATEKSDQEANMCSHHVANMKLEDTCEQTFLKLGSVGIHAVCTGTHVRLLHDN